MVVEYDGTCYHGFQYQDKVPTIQDELERSVSNLTKETVKIKGAGRTDTGVHAKGQVVVFDTQSTLSTNKITEGLNHYLPKDIAIQSAFRTGDEFDPRRDAHSRRYRYTIINKEARAPLSRRMAHRVSGSLSVEAMSKAAKVMEGIHDFEAFGGSSRNKAESTVRRVYSAAVWQEKQGDEVYFEVEANAFLTYQVRRMAGALVDVGLGRLTENDIGRMLQGTSGKIVANTLPPQGLCLIEVTYDNFPP